MLRSTTALSRGGIEINAVLRNTYLLLSMTLVFSAITAFFGTQVHFGLWGYIGVVVAAFASLFAIHAFKNSGWAVLLVFSFTGLMGFSMGPMLQHYLAMPNGSNLIISATGITAVLFAGLSAYVVISGKNYGFLGGMLFMALLALVLVSLVGIFFPSPMMHLALAYAGVLIFSGYVLYDTSAIIHGGETNYVLATVSLYLDILNLFTSILRILRD